MAKAADTYRPRTRKGTHVNDTRLARPKSTNAVSGPPWRNLVQQDEPQKFTPNMIFTPAAPIVQDQSTKGAAKDDRTFPSQDQPGNLTDVNVPLKRAHPDPNLLASPKSTPDAIGTALTAEDKTTKEAEKNTRNMGRDQRLSEEGPLRKRICVDMDQHHWINSGPVVILVGNNKARFYVHEKLLIDNPARLKKVVENIKTRSEERLVILPDYEPDVFGIFASFLYSGKAVIFNENNVNTPGRDHDLNKWMNCYEFGRYAQNRDFQDASIDALIERMCHRKHADSSLIHILYAGSDKSPILRKLSVDLYYAYGTTKKTRAVNRDNCACEFCKEFALDALSQIGHKLKDVPDQGGPLWTSTDNTCGYHEDMPLKEPCYKAKSYGYPA